MFYLKLVIFLFVAGSFNVIAMLLAHTLPSLKGIHMEAVAVTAAFLLMANAIFLYILFFRSYLFDKSDRYKKIEDIIGNTEDMSEKEFEKAVQKWKDER
ncbi:MAG: hypothetical protein ACLFN5_01575 [bacterium]